MFTEGMIASLVPFCLAACLLVILVIRTIRKSGTRRVKSPFQQVKDAKTAFDKAEPNKDFPLLDADPRQRKWQAEMHDLARDYTAQIETKMALLNATIRLADKKIQTLQALQNSIDEKQIVSKQPKDEKDRSAA